MKPIEIEQQQEDYIKHEFGIDEQEEQEFIQ